MLFFLQAAAQHLPPGLPPINVTVQQPVGGMSEWVKILISAGVGALFGILGSIGMEYARPVIAKRRMLKEVTKQLKDEVRSGAEVVRECVAQLETMPRESGPERQNAMLFASVFLSGRLPTPDDRYLHYFDHQKEIVYAIDNRHLLLPFYNGVKAFTSYASLGDFTTAYIHAEFALKAAREFLEGH
jgi:hypothetical protein